MVSLDKSHRYPQQEIISDNEWLTIPNLFWEERDVMGNLTSVNLFYLTNKNEPPPKSFQKIN